jgi:hypothetical protein
MPAKITSRRQRPNGSRPSIGSNSKCKHRGNGRQRPTSPTKIRTRARFNGHAVHSSRSNKLNRCCNERAPTTATTRQQVNYWNSTIHKVNRRRHLNRHSSIIISPSTDSSFCIIPVCMLSLSRIDHSLSLHPSSSSVRSLLNGRLVCRSYCCCCCSVLASLSLSLSLSIAFPYEQFPDSVNLERLLSRPLLSTSFLSFSFCFFLR